MFETNDHHFCHSKGLSGHTAIIQKNAIASWTKLSPRCQIILMGKDEGVKAAAEGYGAEYVPDIEYNAEGTPLLSSAFQVAQEMAMHPVMCYVNSDIILFNDLLSAVKRISMAGFLMVSRKTDLNVTELLDFEAASWETVLRQRTRENGKLYGPDAIDYFIFPRLKVEMLPFPVGRAMWDNWFIFKSRRKRFPVIDATQKILAIHQNHGYDHVPGGKEAAWMGEVQKNWELVGPGFYPLDIREATWLMDQKGLYPASDLKAPAAEASVFPALSSRLRFSVRIARNWIVPVVFIEIQAPEFL